MDTTLRLSDIPFDVGDLLDSLSGLKLPLEELKFLRGIAFRRCRYGNSAIVTAEQADRLRAIYRRVA